MGVKYEGGMYGGLHTAHQPSEQRGFAGACLAGNDDKTLASLDAVTQASESFPIKRVAIGKSRIGSDAKGQLYKPKMLGVHILRSLVLNANLCRDVEQKNVLVYITGPVLLEDLFTKFFCSVLGLQLGPNFSFLFPLVKLPSSLILHMQTPDHSLSTIGCSWVTLLLSFMRFTGVIKRIHDYFVTYILDSGDTAGRLRSY